MKAFAFRLNAAANEKAAVFVAGPFVIDWGDGQTTEGVGKTTLNAKGEPSNHDMYSHTYTKGGTYDIYVTGTPTYVSTAYNWDNMKKNKITKVLDFSLPSVTSYHKAFDSCYNMTGDLSNMEFPPQLQNATKMFAADKVSGKIPELPNTLMYASGMFDCAYGVTGFKVAALPTSLKNANSMFTGCDFSNITLPPIPEGLENGYAMFSNTKIKGTVPTLPNTLTNAGFMFRGTNLSGPVKKLPDSLTNGFAMFMECPDITGFDFTAFPNNIESASQMFLNCPGLKGKVPTLPGNLKDASSMFKGTGITGLNFTAFPNRLEKAEEMFKDCKNLDATLPTLPNNLTDATEMFYGATKLKGQCPQGSSRYVPPANIVKYKRMFKDTNVTCKYGK